MNQDHGCSHGILRRHCPSCAWDENKRLRVAMTRVEDHLRRDGFVDFADALERIRTATEEAHEQKA